MLKQIKLDSLLKMDENELQNYLHKRLALMGRSVTVNPEFLYSPGSVPVLLVAHMDTVHRQLPTVCKSEDGEIIMAPEGIGGDDRAGIFAVMKILEKHDCHVVFTQGEEIGGIGARAFVQSGIVPDINFIIEPDRKGSDDAVFYDCGNDDFIMWVEKVTGYKEAWGSFSDISIIAPALNRAAVNLSVGYYDQHTNYEHIKYSEVLKTIEAMDKLITAKGAARTYDFQRLVYVYKKGTGNIYGGGNYSYKDDYKWGDEYDDYYNYDTGGKYYSQKAKAAPVAPVTPMPTKPKVVDNPVYTGNYKYEDELPVKATDEEIAEFEEFIRDETMGYLYALIGDNPPAELVDDIAIHVYLSLCDWGFAE